MSAKITMYRVMAETIMTNASDCMAHRVHQAILYAKVDPSWNVGEQASMTMMPYLLLICSMIVGGIGHKILRPSLMLIAFCVGGAASLNIFYVYGNALHNWNCEGVVFASLGVGGICALLAALVVRMVAFALGAIAGAAFNVLFFDVCTACGEQPWENAAMFLGRYLVPFWLTLVVCSLIGGYVCRKQQVETLALVTSLIGGWGI